MDSEARDIVIVGAGLVGAVQALLLARAGNKVMLIERRSLDASLVNNSKAQNVRTVALSHRSWQLLAAADLWPDIDHCAIDTVHVSEQGKFGGVTLNARSVKVDALGYVISNSDFETFLYDKLRSEPYIEIVENSHVLSITQSQNEVTVFVQRQEAPVEIRTELLIAADGASSSVRTLLDIDVDERDYQQCAVIANVATSRAHQHRAFERFTKSGPLALLPLKTAMNDGHWCSMILTDSNEIIEKMRSLSDKEILQRLQKKFGGRLGRFEKIGPRVVAPLKLTVSARQVDRRCVLIGNASRTLHPVAGQGLNLAIRDIFELAASLKTHREIDVALDNFSDKRRRDQSLITRQTDILARVFTEKPWPFKAPLSLATGSSFLLLEIFNPLKNKFAAVSMGKHVPFPR